MSKWQPIETAPKDGTWVLAASFNPDGSFAYEPRRTSWGATRYFGMQWCSTSTWFSPTHWIPLPDPPTVEEGKADPALGKSEDVREAIGSATKTSSTKAEGR